MSNCFVVFLFCMTLWFDLFTPSLRPLHLSQYQRGVVHLESLPTEKKGSVLTNQGETTFRIKIELPFWFSTPCYQIPF